jgi:hypothetical protein
VVVDARSSAARPLAVIGQLPDVPEVIIRPDDSNVVRQGHPAAIDVEHFLVRAEDLRHSRDLRSHVPGEHLALQRDDLLQPLSLFVDRPAAGHAAVVDAAHADGVDVLELGILSDTLLPVIQNHRQVRDGVPLAHRRLRPLRHIVPQHLLAMR